MWLLKEAFMWRSHGGYWCAFRLRSNVMSTVLYKIVASKTNVTIVDSGTKVIIARHTS